MATLNGWNKISPMVLTREGMKKPGALVTLFEKITFDFLAKEHVFCRFQPQ
jgi:hypothetical protein